jgi:hypothetical protein
MRSLRQVAVAVICAALAAIGNVFAQSPPPTQAPAPTPDAPPSSESGAPSSDSSSSPAPNAPAPGPTDPAAPTAPPAPAPSAPATPPAAATPAPTPTPPPPPSPDPTSVTVIGSKEVQGILGNEVRSVNNESMGRIADVIVDGEGKPRAVIIDFGGFLGVGSRKIAVDWKALHFVPGASKRYSIALELTKEQVKAAPEYKEGQPIVILGASGSLEPIP